MRGLLVADIKFGYGDIRRSSTHTVRIIFLDKGGITCYQLRDFYRHVAQGESATLTR